jgi:3-methylfumaryl-CoA hydratase
MGAGVIRCGDAGQGAVAGHDGWIGRHERREDVVSERMVARFRATLAGCLGPGVVPPGFHWTLAPDVAVPADLGRDGHPRPGLVLPALPLPRRMWAGGALEWKADLVPGETVVRDTTIADIAFKDGRSGPLGFVTVRHRYTAAGAMRLDERHDIVYRPDPAPGAAPAAAPSPAEPWDAARSWTVTPDPVLLFRYSALTFNGHRIHYDHPYATAVEGHAGLVVHGPLQATWMLNLAAAMLGRHPARFSYRALGPLICATPARIEARDEAAGIALRVVAGGAVTMAATATG